MGVLLSPKHGLNVGLSTCWWCGKEKNEIIMLGRLPGDKEAPRNAIYNYDPCDTCKANMSQGITVIEATDTKKHYPEMQKNVYPTGRWLVVKEDILDNFLDADFAANVRKHRKTFMDVQAFTSIFGAALADIGEGEYKNGI